MKQASHLRNKVRTEAEPVQSGANSIKLHHTSDIMLKRLVKPSAQNRARTNARAVGATNLGAMGFISRLSQAFPISGSSAVG
jgi:hypothetical protein